MMTGGRSEDTSLPVFARNWASVDGSQEKRMKRGDSYGCPGLLEEFLGLRAIKETLALRR